MSSLVGPMGKRGNQIPSGYRQSQISNFTPEQEQLFQQSFGHLGEDSYLSRLAGGDQSFFDEMEAPAKRQFSGQMGNLASRFSGKGTGGRHSSGFQNEMTSAGSNFSQDLQANRQSLQRQALQDLMGFSNQLLNQRPYETKLVQKQQQQSGTSKWAPLVGGAIGAGVGLLGGPFGASAGYAAGNAFGEAFG